MPPEGGLSPLQRRILAVLSGIEPAWTLSGGGALCGFHLMHRTTRDLDLFWHGRERLDQLRQLVVDQLEGERLEVEMLHGAASFQRIRVSDAREAVIVDLVADPLGTVEPPVTMTLAAGAIQVDTVHEILVTPRVFARWPSPINYPRPAWCTAVSPHLPSRLEPQVAIP